MVELGKRGANWDITHPDRREWENLRSELRYMGLRSV